MAQQETSYTSGGGAAVTRLPDGRTRWVIDTTGPIRYDSFIRYLQRSHRSYALIHEDGLHYYEGIDEPLPEPAQPDRPLTFMHQRGGRWFFNDVDSDDSGDSDDEMFMAMRRANDSLGEMISMV